MTRRSVLALGALGVAATALVAAPSTATVDDDPGGHLVRAGAPCSGDVRIVGRVRPVSTRSGDLMVASFRVTGAEPGRRWTFSTTIEGGGSVGSGDGEFTVDDQGRATFGDLAGDAHVRQALEVLADEDPDLPGLSATSCRLRLSVRY